MAVRSLNKVMLIGNLTRDPDLRFTPSGTAICTFGIATNRSWVPSDGGERREEAEFHNIVSWSKLAEICGELLHVGDKVYVEGRLQTRDWKTQEGDDRRTTEVVIDEMILLRRPRGSRYNDDDDDDNYQSDKSSSSSSSQASSDDDDDAKDEKKDSKKAKKDKKEDEAQAEDVSDDIPF